jgi:hypothetical protein
MAGLGANEGDASGSDGRSHAGSGKEPGLELIQLPVAPQQRQQGWGQPHKAIAFALALAYADDHAVRVDVGTLELTEFGDPDAGRIQGSEDRPMLEVAWGQQQRLDLVTTEDDGERLGPFGIGDAVDHPRAVQGGLVEKAEGTHGRDKNALRGVRLEEMQLLGADVLRAEAIRRGAKVFGELGGVAQIAIDRVG